MMVLCNLAKNYVCTKREELRELKSCEPAIENLYLSPQQQQ